MLILVALELIEVKMIQSSPPYEIFFGPSKILTSLALRGVSKNKNLPLTARMAAKSLSGDSTPFTEKDMTPEQLETLRGIYNNSVSRKKNQKYIDNYGDAIYNTIMSDKNLYEQAMGTAKDYEEFTFDNQTGTLPQHRAYYTYLDSEGIQPVDYWNTINVTSDKNKTYGGSNTLKENIDKIFNDKKFDMYHSIGRAKANGNTVTDRYDFAKLEGDLRKYNKPSYNLIHDVVRTFGKPYDVNINLGE